MSIQTKILADSINPMGQRLTTWLLTYPRIIHAEFMTHRIFSRNAASSRAIPFSKMIEAVEYFCDVIERWGSEQKGMQAGSVLDDKATMRARLCWAKAAGSAMAYAKHLHELGVHKSICNRLLEPFTYITVIATATDHSNFYALRCCKPEPLAQPMAQAEFQKLAFKMLHDHLQSQPIELDWGQWHIPRFNEVEAQIEPLPIQMELQVATARCARVSYTTHGKEFALGDQIALHDRLRDSGHWSPFEHPAQAVEPQEDDNWQYSNFDIGDRKSGWRQYRKCFDNECPVGYSTDQLAAIYAQKPDWITL
jgi:hypothetical protein